MNGRFAMEISRWRRNLKKKKKRKKESKYAILAEERDRNFSAHTANDENFIFALSSRFPDEIGRSSPTELSARAEG